MNQTPPTYRHVPRQQAQEKDHLAPFMPLALPDAQEKMHGQASGTSRMTSMAQIQETGLLAMNSPEPFVYPEAQEREPSDADCMEFIREAMGTREVYFIQSRERAIARHALKQLQKGSK